MHACRSHMMGCTRGCYNRQFTVQFNLEPAQPSAGNLFCEYRWCPPGTTDVYVTPARLHFHFPSAKFVTLSSKHQLTVWMGGLFSLMENFNLPL